MTENDKETLIQSEESPNKVSFGNPQVLEFKAIAELTISRRSFLRGSVAGIASFVFGHEAFAADIKKICRLDFDEVAANRMDTITVPTGYTWHIVGSWGDPLWSKGIEFDHITRGTAASQALAMGDNTDGMEFFSYNGRHILAQNNEYVNRSIIYGNRNTGLPENVDDIRKGKAAHGVSVFEVTQLNGKWKIIKDSQYNRRITADSPMEITGPAAGHELMKTAADPSGTRSLGTWNNCGSGRTPWGTYLTCEENFNIYFSSSDENAPITAELKRYGVNRYDYGYGWALDDERFDISKHPNEPNRVGYVVEIDPLNPNSIPKKRTALGRLKHENAEVVVAANNHIVVYMGDDERGEFIYKFVSAEPMKNGSDNSGLLDHGTLFVARFEENSIGKWLELSPSTAGMASQAEICIHTRQAASAVGATTMDRPEWVAANPLKAEVYCCLTNNRYRGIRPNAGGDPTPVGGTNPRKANQYGHIIRWTPDNDDHLSDDFQWDMYVLAGNPMLYQDSRRGSPNITPENMFNSPDGLAFDSNGLLWIQTDGNYSSSGDFEGMGNNQMLVGNPETGEIKRFMVGPKECEVTGITWSADKRTLFVGIQHPGERGGGHFPGGGESVPRSSIIAINREDDKPIG